MKKGRHAHEEDCPAHISVARHVKPWRSRICPHQGITKPSRSFGCPNQRITKPEHHAHTAAGCIQFPGKN
eukprot:352441-Chlamydomonas_euryale.AAC.1